MKVYNTLTKKTEEFVPKKEGIVKLYTCGPTVYHYAHIGNLRTYIFEDILEKTLIYLGYEVDRFMNITDLGHLTGDSDTGEDKMAKSAREQHKKVEEIADFYTAEFLKDLAKLNVKRPAKMDKASNHIDTYIKIIEKLIEDGYAYLSNGNVYFDISKYSDYYKLSGRKEEESIVGAREDVEEDKNKRNPADFGLWFTNSKFSGQLQIYESPWGKGYPGWHIECTGLAIEYLGDYLDIHCGGVDNIFPHHTNEIAQSESYIGGNWCKYWLHGEHLNDIDGKMSKSKGTFLTLNRVIEEGINPLSYRYFVLASHYRNQLVFTFEALRKAEKTYLKLKQKINQLKKEEDKNDENIEKYKLNFKEALENDLNTSNALTVVYDVLKSDLSDGSKLSLIAEFDRVLSLDLLKEEKTEISEERKNYIETMIEKRNQAKIDKNYELADEIREQLQNEGIILKDTKEKTIWEIVQ